MIQEPIPIISKQFSPVVSRLIDDASDSIDIIVYDWRFYKHDPASAVSLFNASLVRALARGVKIRALVNSPVIERVLTDLGFYAKCLPNDRILHSKLMILDGKKIVIGSHNYSQHAFTSNHEASVFFTLSDISNEFTKYFNNLYGL